MTGAPDDGSDAGWIPASLGELETIYELTLHNNLLSGEYRAMAFLVSVPGLCDRRRLAGHHASGDGSERWMAFDCGQGDRGCFRGLYRDWLSLLGWVYDGLRRRAFCPCPLIVATEMRWFPLRPVGALRSHVSCGGGGQQDGDDLVLLGSGGCVRGATCRHSCAPLPWATAERAVNEPNDARVHRHHDYSS